MRKILLYVCIVLLASCGQSKSSTYLIGIDPSWYPQQLMGLEEHVLAFSIELLVEISQREKLPIAVINRGSDNLIEDLKKKQYDAILSSMRPYSFYMKTFSFSDLYIQTGPVIIVPRKSKVQSKADLKSMEVGVVAGSSSTILLQSIPGLILQSFPNITLTLNALNTQKVQAASIPILVAQRFVSDIYSKVLRITTPPLDNEGLRLITLYESSPKLMMKFNRGLSKIKKDGTYTRLLTKWGLAPNSAPPSRKAIKAFIETHFPEK